MLIRIASIEAMQISISMARRARIGGRTAYPGRGDLTDRRRHRSSRAVTAVRERTCSCREQIKI